MTDDVLAKLDRYLNNDKMMGDMIVGSGLGPALATEIRRQAEMVQRARDEIVALRGLLEHSDRTVITAIAVATPAIRDEALEEAARVCELSAEIMQPDERRLGDAIAAVKSCAAAIRALKGGGDD